MGLDIPNGGQKRPKHVYVHISVHHNSMYLEDQRDAVLSSLYLFTAESLYMFRVSPAPIIRSTQTLVTTTGTGHEFEDVMIKPDYKESMDEQLTTGTGHEFEDVMIKPDYKESMDEQL